MLVHYFNRRHLLAILVDLVMYTHRLIIPNRVSPCMQISMPAKSPFKSWPKRSYASEQLQTFRANGRAKRLNCNRRLLEIGQRRTIQMKYVWQQQLSGETSIPHSQRTWISMQSPAQITTKKFPGALSYLLGWAIGYEGQDYRLPQVPRT